MRRVKSNPPINGETPEVVYVSDENDIQNQTAENVILLKDGNSILYERQSDGTYKMIGDIATTEVELEDITEDEVEAIWNP